MNDYTALEPIAAPGTLVFGYQRGDAVSADVVTSWGLDVGAQVCEGDLPADDEPPAPVVPEPDAAAPRADWEAWAIANGMDPDEAAQISMDELQAYRPGGPPNPARPADSAPKAAWIAFVEALGADPTWAEDSGTTKADLQAWKTKDPA